MPEVIDTEGHGFPEVLEVEAGFESSHSQHQTLLNAFEGYIRAVEGDWQ